MEQEPNELNDVEPVQTREAQPPRPARGSSGIALLALLAATGLGGWSYLQWQQGEQQRAGYEQRLATLNDALTTLRAENQREQQVTQAEITRLGADQRLLSESLNRVRALAGLLPRNGWVVAEAEYLVRIAQQTLATRGDAQTAAAALEAAAARLASLGAPELEDARTLLAADIAALRSLPPPPAIALNAELAQLATACASLPLRTAIARVQGREEKAGGADIPPFDWRDWHQWRDRAQAALGELVTIRRSDHPAEPLIAPREEYFLRESLRLQLERARLALYRDDPEGYRTALTEARGWIGRYFRVDDAGTGTLLTELDRLQRVKLARDLPDLAPTLKALLDAAPAQEATP